MSYELATVVTLLGTACVTFWLSKMYDQEHALYKLYLQLIGYCLLLGTFLALRFLIPLTNTALLEFHDVLFMLFLVTLTIPSLLYWFYYTLYKLWIGEVKLSFKLIRRNIKENGRGDRGLVKRR